MQYNFLCLEHLEMSLVCCYPMKIIYVVLQCIFVLCKFILYSSFMKLMSG